MNNKRTLNILSTTILLILVFSMATNSAFISIVSATPTGPYPTSLAITPKPATATAGTNITFAATVTYSDHTTLGRSSEATWTINATAGTYRQYGNIFMVNKTGVYTVTASYSYFSDTVSDTTTLTVTAAAGSKVVYIGPSQANAGSASAAFHFQLQDAYGNVVNATSDKYITPSASSGAWYFDTAGSDPITLINLGSGRNLTALPLYYKGDTAGAITIGGSATGGVTVIDSTNTVLPGNPLHLILFLYPETEHGQMTQNPSINMPPLPLVTG